MGAVSEYVTNIKDAVTSIFEGMAVTASHFMRKPYTVQYPDRMPVRVQDTLPFRYRGILEVDLEICTGCLACERACPIDCITIVAEKDPQTRQLLLSQFDIDIAKCMYCGLCSEPCPTKKKKNPITTLARICAPVGRSPFASAQSNRIVPADRWRKPAVYNGGIVSTAYRIAR